MKFRILLAVSLVGAAISGISPAATRPVVIGLDAEFGHKTSSSAQAIERGIALAIDEINEGGGVLGGRPLTLVTRDNRAMPARSRQNIRELADMNDLVAIFTGKFSPVALDILSLVHERRVLFLDPWAAADGIINNGYSPNFAFRLSLRDSWAVPKLVDQAKKRGFRKIGMMAPKNGWGKSSAQALEQLRSADAGSSFSFVGIRWHFWGDRTLVAQYRELARSGAEAIILVANETEAAILLREVAALPEAEKVPLISHWGVSGGDLRTLVGDLLDRVDFTVIQTFTFAHNRSPVALRTAARAIKKYGLSSISDIKSQVGFAHGYDLTHILARAIQKAGTAERDAVRQALENLDSYDGLVRRYDRPFTPESHEALSPDVLFMGRFSKAGDIHRVD